MIEIQNMKIVGAVSPVALANGSATGIEVDARTWHNARFVFHQGVSTGNMSVAKIQSATTSGGSFTDVTDAALADGVIDTTNDTLYAIEVDLTDNSVGDFLKVVLTEDNTGSAVIGCTCILSRGSKPPTTAAGRGMTAESFA